MILKKDISKVLHLIELKIMNNLDNLNVLALAYMGDAVYELYIRNYLVTKGITKVNNLQKEAIKYVSANSQANYLKLMIDNNFLDESEIEIIKRARNHKSHKCPKSTDVTTYRNATGLEALIGYLYLKNNHDRMNQIMKFIVGE